MKETLDIRANNDWVESVYGSEVGEVMYPFSPDGRAKTIFDSPDIPPSGRKIIVDSHSDLFKDIKHRVLLVGNRWQGDVMVTSVGVTRRYTQQEIESADRFYIYTNKVINTCGTDWGTLYDLSHACEKCGHGRRQLTALRLNTAKLPNRYDVAITIARDELVVSNRFAKIMQDARIEGFEFVPIEHAGRGKSTNTWFQIVITKPSWDAVSPTKFGDDFIHDFPNPDYECAVHKYRGLHVLTELHITPCVGNPSEVSATRDRIGLWGGVLAPHPMIVVGRTAMAAIRNADIRGLTIEVAHQM